MVDLSRFESCHYIRNTTSLPMIVLTPISRDRFVLYAVPLLNVAGAYVVALLWKKGLFAKLVVVGGLLTNLLCE